MNPDTLDRLARYRVRSRPWRRKLDDDGAGISVEVPDPADLAPLLAISADLAGGATLYRTGDLGLQDEDGAAPAFGGLRDLARLLVESWAVLPQRADAGRAYRDLRTLATVSPDRSAMEYALDVVRAWRRSLPRPPKRSSAPRESRAPVSTRDRKRAQREREHQEERSSSRWWLGGYVTGWGDEDEAPSSGSRVVASTLFGMAREALEEVVEQYADEVTEPTEAPYTHMTPGDRLSEWREQADRGEVPPRPRVPGRSLFYSLADEVLGDRAKYAGRDVYTIPAKPNLEEVPTMTTITPEEVAEALEIRDVVRMLREQRKRLAPRDAGGHFAATGTDGGDVVDIESRRRSR